MGWYRTSTLNIIITIDIHDLLHFYSQIIYTQTVTLEVLNFQTYFLIKLFKSNASTKISRIEMSF